MKVALPHQEYPFYEGQDLVQYLSSSNDVPVEKELRIKRRRHATPKEARGPRSIEEIQKLRSMNEERELRAQSTLKVLEQTSKTP